MEHVNFLITSAPSSELHGGKGSNLIKLIKIGANIPPGFILTTEAYEKFIKESKNYDELRELLSKSFSKKDVIEHSAKIIELIMNSQIPYIIDMGSLPLFVITTALLPFTGKLDSNK